MTRPFILFGILLISTAAAAPNLPKQESPGNRIPRWQHYLNESDFQFQKEEACAVYSARQYRGAAKLHLINDSEKWWTGVTLRFGPDGNLLVLNSNWESVFRESNNILFYASYWDSDKGCTITAYDLNSGKQLWEMPLNPLGLIAHFAYSNEVNLDLPFGAAGADEVVSVKGHESYGDYQVILDMKTGEELAHKVYRKGWK